MKWKDVIVAFVILVLVVNQIQLLNEVRELRNEISTMRRIVYNTRGSLVKLESRMKTLNEMMRELKDYHEMKMGKIENITIISKTEFYEMLLDTIFGRHIVVTMDERYMIIDKSETTKVRLWINNVWNPYHTYSDDFWDCDDIAFDFYISMKEWVPIAVGVVMTLNHAYNVIFYIDNGELKYMIYDPINKQYIDELNDDEIVMLII